MTATIHRIIEQHAALRGDFSAIRDGDRAMSYRELNYAANAMARRLQSHGFRRGGHANVTLPLGMDLAIVLLAILKAGGSYSWSAPSSGDEPSGVSFAVASSGTEDQYLHLDVSPSSGERVPCSPNLPIVTRGSDVACILQEVNGERGVMVPHSTIAALRPQGLAHTASCVGEPGAFDLWMALTAGATAVMGTHATAAAA